MRWDDDGEGKLHEGRQETVYPEAVQSLFLDTASHEHALALVGEDRTVALYPLPSFGDTALLATFEKALKEAGWKDHDLTHIACVTGPGGFASIRTGITAANTLAYALKIPLGGVHVSDLWEERVRFGVGSSPNPSPSPHTLWLHSTKKNLLFVRGFGALQEKFSEPTLLTLEDAAKLQGNFVGELLEEHQKALAGCTPIPGKDIASIPDVLPSLLKNLSYGKESLLPWYGREP